MKEKKNLLSVLNEYTTLTHDEIETLMKHGPRALDEDDAEGAAAEVKTAAAADIGGEQKGQ